MNFNKINQLLNNMKEVDNYPNPNRGSGFGNMKHLYKLSIDNSKLWDNEDKYVKSYTYRELEKFANNLKNNIDTIYLYFWIENKNRSTIVTVDRDKIR